MTQYYTATELVTHICEHPHGVTLCGIPTLELGGEPVISELRSVNPAPRQCQICASEQARILLEKTRGGKAQATPPEWGP